MRETVGRIIVEMLPDEGTLTSVSVPVQFTLIRVGVPVPARVCMNSANPKSNGVLAQFGRVRYEPSSKPSS